MCRPRCAYRSSQTDEHSGGLVAGNAQALGVRGHVNGATAAGLVTRRHGRFGAPEPSDDACAPGPAPPDPLEERWPVVAATGTRGCGSAELAPTTGVPSPVDPPSHVARGLGDRLASQRERLRIAPAAPAPWSRTISSARRLSPSQARGGSSSATSTSLILRLTAEAKPPGELSNSSASSSDHRYVAARPGHGLRVLRLLCTKS